MKGSRLGAWLAIAIGAIYFIVPLIGTFEFSLRMRRGEYSFDAYRIVLADPQFQATFTYSTCLALASIVVGVLLVVPRFDRPEPLVSTAIAPIHVGAFWRPTGSLDPWSSIRAWA